ncbi:alpha/beta hydrolase [Myxococcus llanfairpwllgwyngyllgogerychwyrndrobwllllantysiliogogogochensis]|nr:alpha/beta hydrolase [Myxococcus llanfairpwllgwyngyllgogerychwyrndrobwllllantysiliogogogochensis]
MSSLRMSAAKFWLGLRKKYRSDPEAFRRTAKTRTYPTIPALPRALHALTKVEERKVAGRAVFNLTPRQRASGWHLIYAHGGAYVNEFILPHWRIIESLIRHTGASVTVPIYPLAPEFTHRDAYPFLTEVYRQVLATTPATQVALCGDSAGGGLALGQTFHFRDLGLPLPGRLILFSPWLDLAMTNPGIPAIEPRDVMLSTARLLEAGQWWAGGDDLSIPTLSPIHGDLRGLPPIDVFQGTDDLFILDARELRGKVEAVGGSIRLYEYPGAFHVFVGATFTPEARDAFRKVAHGLGSSHRE